MPGTPNLGNLECLEEDLLATTSLCSVKARVSTNSTRVVTIRAPNTDAQESFDIHHASILRLGRHAEMAGNEVELRDQFDLLRVARVLDDTLDAQFVEFLLQHDAELGVMDDGAQ